MTRKVLTFFYGSYINFEVLKEVNLIPDEWQVAILPNYELQIAPLANIVRSDKNNVYGIVVKATHEELERLYNHAEHVLGGIYLPEAVLVTTVGGSWMPAMCYISHDMKNDKADNDYIERILKPAKAFQFPEWYLARIESFKN